jgi:hypothetical protein
MKGFIYRIGVSLKDFGERARLQIFIKAGISIRDFARKI